jgi:hypothetical protein
MRYSVCALSISLTVASLGVGGCMVAKPAQPEAMNDAPLVVDDAMQKRNFPKTEATYPNGAVLAGPTWETFQPRPDVPYQVNAIAEPGIFVGNIFLMPYQMFRQPPGSSVVWPGAVIEPTYSAMPPLPASPSQQSTDASETPPTTQP